MAEEMVEQTEESTTTVAETDGAGETQTNAAETQEFVFPANQADDTDAEDADASTDEQGTEDAVDSDEPAEPATNEEKTETAAQQPGLSPEDVELAHQAGFTDEFMASLGIKTRDQLEYVAGAILQQKQAQAAAQQSDQQGSTQEKKAEPVASDIDWAKLESEYDEGVVATLKAIDAKTQQVSALPQQIIEHVQQQLLAPIMEEVQLLRMERFDGFITGLGEQWKDVFGEGSTMDLDQASDSFKNRQRLSKAVGTILTGRQAVGGSKVMDRALLQRGLNQEFGSLLAEKAVKAKSEKIVSSLTKQKSQTLVRPGGVRAAKPTSATPNLDAKLAELGITDDDDE